MAADGAAEREPSPCCIAHEFHRVASRSPDRIAVIHASGSVRTASDCSEYVSMDRASSSGPPVYDGDECFTFSEILSAVENLSSRLWHIHRGADDLCLIKPQPGLNFTSGGKRDHTEHFSESMQDSCQSPQNSTKVRNLRTPKVIGIYMEPSVEYIVAVLSVLRCGEAFMPLDPTWPKTRILSLISSSKVDLVVGVESFPEGNYCHMLDSLKWLIDEGSCHVLHFSMKETSKGQSHPLLLEWPCESENPRSFCYLMYTSGSSGKPKGVCGTETGLLNRYLWMQEMYPLHEVDVVLFKTAVSFIDHVQEFLGAVLSICTLVIPPFNQLKENIFYLVQFLQGYFINRLVAVPSLMRTILPSLQSPHSTTIQGSLKLLILSGEVLHISLCKMLQKLLPQTSILNLYGSTEVAGDCTYFDCARLPLILEKEALSSVPVGLSMSNCDVVLVGDDAPYQGEIHVGGMCVAAGYLDHPHLIPLEDVDMSSKYDIPGPNGGCRFQHYFKTGDFARKLPSGDLVFLGRKDRTVKVNGQRISLEEIEGAFCDHPDVFDATVLSRNVDDEVLLLEAHVVREKASGAELLEPSLRNWVLSKLPYMMIPSRILFTESLPLTSSGKVDHLSLAASRHSDEQVGVGIGEIHQDYLIEVIKKVLHGIF